MIVWILVVLLFTQDGNGKENGVLQCEPQNMTLTTPDRTILLTWEDDPACLVVHDVLMYEVVVLIADNQVHYSEVAVTPDQIGSMHSWNWTAGSVLEYISHSVRLSSRYKNHTSPWKQQKTHPGIDTPKKTTVLPLDRVFQVGSSATFYCVLSAGDIFDKMCLGGVCDTTMKATKISHQTYALTVDLNLPSKTSCTNVICKTKTNDYGACAYIGYPPGDRDLHCETRDLQSVECLWTVGKTHLNNKSPTVYHLLGSPCADGSKGRCSQKVQVNIGEWNGTLTAQNQLGTVELTYRADLTKRVYMYAPKEVTASAVNARNVSLKWGWRGQQYNNLNITCQVNVNDGEINTISENFGVGLNLTVLGDLIPNWKYTVMVRCGTTQHFWKWSEWSLSTEFHTKGDVPDPVDVWMQMMDNQTIILWKILKANQSHGQIIDYTVKWAHTKTPEREKNTTVAHPQDNLTLSLDTTEEYIIGVTARNIHGNSSSSTITIPSFDPANRSNTSRILGSDGGFNLSWSASPTASCGYIVDWCPTSGECRVEWLKVPTRETNSRIFSRNFKDGLRYLLSIYACTQGAPVLLERKEGYVREKRIQNGLFQTLKSIQQGSDVEVSWDPISLRAQTAFIKGYILYSCDSKSNICIIFSTDNPEATSLTARDLNLISTYTFTVTAQTAVGECGNTTITAILNSQTDYVIKVVFISLVTVFGLLSLTTTICYRKWTCIKQKIYPPIPKPVLMDQRLTSPGELIFCPLRMDLFHHNEAHIMDVPELHCKSGAPVNGLVSLEKKPYVFTQTPNDYYNQPLKKPTPPALILPTTILSGLPSSPFRNVFPNHSYDLIMQTGDQQSNSGPDFHEGTLLERCSSGYQPQSLINLPEEDPESHLSCVPNYILLPHLSK